jgi:hypothetical protein
MKRLPRLLLLVCALLPLHAAALPAQEPEPGAQLRVYLMTLGPGNAVWERFGHNAIVVEDPGTGSSIAYNWGMFDFAQPGYVPRLMQGRMLYWMAGYDTQAFANVYVQDNRSIWLQELNLTPQQKVAMRDFVEWNAQEANKFYRYDYYRDNCSTRVRDAIDRALGGQLAAVLKRVPTAETYRSHTQRLTYQDPAVYTGLQLAMGNPIDERINAWEESFIPMVLRDRVRQVTVRDASGQQVPLVAREVTVFEARREPLAEHAPNLVIWYLIVGVLLGAGFVYIGRGPWDGARRVMLAITVGLWSLLVGFFGLLISLLWAFTDHAVTYYNENVLQANVLSLLLAGFVVSGMLWRRGERTMLRLALGIAGLSVFGFVLQVFPQLDQVNGEIIALLMPVHVAIAYVLSSPRSTVTA